MIDSLRPTGFWRVADVQRDRLSWHGDCIHSIVFLHPIVHAEYEAFGRLSRIENAYLFDLPAIAQSQMLVSHSNFLGRAQVD